MDIIIIGAGRLGFKLAKDLSEENHNVTVVDYDESRVDKAVETFDVQGVFGRATLCETLSDSGVRNCDLLIATTYSDEHNILSCLIGKKMGAKHTIARVRNPEYSAQMKFMREQLGISLMINPEYAAAREIRSIIQFPSAVTVESFANGRLDIVGIKVREESPIADKRISELSNNYKNKLLICAVSRGDDVFIPNGDFVIKAGDKVHIIGSHTDLYKIIGDFTKKKKSNIKNVMLIGGSIISIYLANMLEDIRKNVIIIEKDKERCNSLYEHCPKASVINGDFTDYSLLTSEGIDKMDAVVTLTDSDDTNFLISKFSESVGVPKNITLVNNSNLPKLLKNIEIDSYVDVAEVTCDAITQYVRAKKSVSSSYMKTLYTLVDGSIEAIEFVAGEDTKFIGKTLSSIKFKKNILIVAVIRAGKIKDSIIIPSGDDVIEKGDSVIVISKDHIVYSLNDIIA